MADLRLQISSDSRRAQQDIDALRREITQLRTQLGQTQGASNTAAESVDKLGDESAQTARQVRNLGEAQGRATGGTQNFTRSLGGLGTILGGIGVAAAGAQLTQFATASVSAAARLEGFERGLRLIEGTNAPQRLDELIEVANLPGLNLTDLIQYSNRLRTLGLTAAETDTLLTSTGQAITAFGGTAHTAAEATEQIIQAISSGTVSLQDFRSIAQRVPGFYQAIADVHGVSANIDGLRTAVENAGGSIKDALIPVMEELSQRFAAPPPESFAASIDALQNSFFLLQAEIGQQLLPVVGESVRALSTLFDALRENDLDALPEPIQAIVRGMQSLFDGFVSVGESIRSGLGPELDLLLPAIGNLLGDILSLAGALVEALAPAYEILAAPTRVAIALIVHLADTIGSVIGAITDFVDWVSGAAASQEELQTATAATARAIGEATAALGEGATATERFQASITDLQTELDSVNTQLEAKRQRLSELAETITSKSHPSYQQLERQITTLEGEQARLTGEITKTQGSLDKQTQSTTATTAATKEAATEAQNYADILANLQKNITDAQRVQDALAETQDGLNAFWRVASGEVGNLNEELETLIPSITDTAAELSALESAIEANNAVMLTAIETGSDLDVVLMHLSEGLTSIAADQAIATAEFNLVNPAISDAVDSLRDYNQALSDVQGEYRSVEEISQDVTDAIRTQGTGFDDLRGKVDTAEISLDDIDATMQEIDSTIEDDLRNSVSSLDIAFEDLGNTLPGFLADTLDLLAAVNSEFEGVANAVSNLVGAAASGNPIAFLASVPGLVDSLNEIQTDENLTTEARANRAFGVIEQIQASDLSASQQQRLISPIQDYITELLTRSILSAPAALSPALIAQHESFAGTRGLDFNFAESRQNLGLGDTPFQTAFELPEIDLSGVITQLEDIERLGNSAKQRRGSGEDITGSPTSGGAGTTARSTAQQPNLQALTDVQSAYIQSLGFDPSQYGYDRRRNAFVKTAGGDGPTLLYDDSVAFDDARIAAPAGSELGTPSATAPTTADPRTTFSFTGDERAILEPYETAVRVAEDAVDDLTADSTVEEIAQAYQDLVFAQTNLSNVSGNIIRAAETAGRITGTAATNAIRTLGLDLGDDLRTANNTLIGSLANVGFEVVGGIENIREAIDVSDISSVFRRIPEEVEAAAEAEEEPEATPEPEALAEVHRFSAAENRRLGILRTAVTAAEDAVGLLDENSTEAEIAAAYTTLANAERDLYATKVGFIQSATGITEDARQDAFTLAEGLFGREIFDANQKLVRALEDVGLQLITTIDATTGILRGTALAAQQIPAEVEAAATSTRRTEPEAEEEPEPLRDVFRFTGAQSRTLSNLRGNIETAENAVRALDEDSSTEDVITAYMGLGEAEQAYTDKQLEFIDAGIGIFDDDALETARAGALTDLTNNAFDANGLLVRSLEDIGFELVNAFTATSGILMGVGLQIRQIPVMAEEAAAEVDPDDPLAPLRSNVNLAANQVRRARTALGESTSEADFETRRIDLIQAVNAAYTAQIALLDALGLSEADYQDRFEDAEDARNSAITRATTSVNTFAEARIKGEEDAAAAAQDAADEKIAAEDRAERERMRIAERQQRDIADLRDDALEAEADRLQSIEDLQDRHLNRVLDLETRFSRDLEDLRRDRIDDTEDLNIEYQRDLEDLQNRFTRSLIDDVIAFADLTAEQQQRVTESTGFQRGLFDLDRDRSRDRQDLGIESGILRPGSGGYQFYRQQLESGELTDTNLIERLFGREGLAEFTQFGRGVSDAESALEQGILDANQEAVGELIDINTKLGNIDESLSVTGVFENIQERIMQGLNPFVEGITEIFTPIQEAVTAIESLTGVFDAVMDGLSQPSQVDAELAMAAAPEAMTLSADIVNINANSVNLSGDVAGGGNGGASDVNVIVEVRNSDVMLDGEKVGQMVGDVIVKQQQQGRSSLGEES